MVSKTRYACSLQGEFIFILDTMKAVQGIILRSPILASSATPEIKPLVDRASNLGIAREELLRRKIGEAFIVGRKAGHNLAFADLLF